MTQFATTLIESLAIGRSFVLPDLEQFVNDNYRCIRLHDAMQLELDSGEAFLFDYGVVVFWGVTENTKQSLLTKIQIFVLDSKVIPDFEQYAFDSHTDTIKMHADKISFANEDSMERLAVSHALAQSVKLAEFERLAQEVIQAHAHIPVSLAKTGKVAMSRKAIAKSRGVLFGARGDILLNYSLLDTPEFFWDYPELEPLYTMVSRYLDVVARINVLNKKLESIHELLDMLANEQNHKHSSTLEWIIIILIALEIVLFLH